MLIITYNVQCVNIGTTNLVFWRSGGGEEVAVVTCDA